MKLYNINKFIHLILSLTLLSSVLAKVKKSKSTSADLKQEEIFKKISSYPTDEGVLNLNEKDFKEFIKTPRNFSLAVALTALGSEFGCTQCVEFDQNLKLIANSWKRNPNKNKLFFGVLDFENAQSTFIKYKLRGAPNLFYFPASEVTSKDPKHEEYELSTKGFDPEPLAKFLEEKTGEKVKIVRPINWRLYGGITAATILIGLAGYFILPKLKNIFVETNIWAALSLVFILMMVSGHMFNQIRHPSFMAQEKSGKVKIWHQGFQDQYGVESQIIALVYGVSSFIIVTLVSKVTPIKNETLKFVLVAILCASLSGTLIYLSSVFYTKFPMYPFTLLK